MATNDLTTLANLKGWLTIAVSQTTDDALLSRLISAVSGYIAAWLNRQLMSTTYTETLNGNGKDRVMLGNAPITAVSSVLINGQSIVAAPAYTADANPSGFAFDDSTLYLLGAAGPGSGKFLKGYQNVIISYTAGYVTVPLEIEQACIELCAMRYRERDRIGLGSKAMAGETTAFITKDMPASVATILQNYKKVVPI